MSNKGSKQYEYMRGNSGSLFNIAFFGLLILFIGLFVISEFNLFKTDNTLPQVRENNQLEVDDPQFDLNDIIEETDELAKDDSATDPFILDSKEFDNLRLIQRNIESYIRQNKIPDVVTTRLTIKGLHINLYTDTVFQQGYANLQTEGRLLIEELAQYVVIHDQHQVVVIGNADDLAVENEKIKSNWELSAMRAMQVRQLLTENIPLKETKFSAMARGDKDPLITNATDKNNYLNRRIEIIVQPKSIS